MTTYRLPLIFVNALFAGILLWSAGFLRAEQTAIGNSPVEYAPAAGHGPAILHLMEQYKSGAISFWDFQTGLAHLGHNVTLAGTSEGGSATGKTGSAGRTTGIIDPNSSGSTDVIPAPEVTKTSISKIAGAHSARLASHDAVVRQTSSAGASPCPAGWTVTTLTGVPPTVPPINCEQDCYNRYAKAWVLTKFAAYKDGSGSLAGGANGAPLYGEISQTVYNDDGKFNIYDNFFMSSPADLQAMVKYQKQYGVTDITFQGPAPDPKAGYQLQVLYAPQHSGGDICSPDRPYYCTPQNLTQSPSCQ